MRALRCVGWTLARRILHGEGDPGHHQGDPVGGLGHALIHEAEEILEAQPCGGRGMDAGTDLAADAEERGLSGGHEGGEIVVAPEDRRVVVAAQEAIRDPEGQAVHEEQVGPAGQAATGGREIERLLYGEPGGPPPRAVAGDAAAMSVSPGWAVAMKAMRALRVRARWRE